MAAVLIIRNGDHAYILPVCIGALIITGIYLCWESLLDKATIIKKGDFEINLSQGGEKKNDE
jgi:hypothetical protein